MSAVAEFIAAMESDGIIPAEQIAHLLGTGQIVRFRCQGDKAGKRNGWAALYLDGTPAGSYGNWKLDISRKWSSGVSQPLTYAERESINRVIQEREAERQAKIAAAKVLVVHVWGQGLREFTGHPYLTKKGLKPFGVRLRGDVLLVPLYGVDWQFATVQGIAANGFKLFFDDISPKELFWHHGVFDAQTGYGTGPLVIGEGYATMAAIHEATGFGVVAAMSAANLLFVAKAMRRLMPRREIIVAADYDGKLEVNLGVVKAREAALAVGGRVAYPFDTNGPTPTVNVDFADISRAQCAFFINAATQAKGN